MTRKALSVWAQVVDAAISKVVKAKEIERVLLVMVLSLLLFHRGAMLSELCVKLHSVRYCGHIFLPPSTSRQTPVR